MTVPLYDLTDTWDAAGTTFTAIKMNVTNTASAAGSLLLDLQIGGSSFVNITKTGDINLTQGAATIRGSTGSSIQMGCNNGVIYLGNTAAFGASTRISNTQLIVTSTMMIGWSSDSTSFGTPDVTLFRDAANILAQRNTTNAQTFRVYKTHTDASNYERATLDWNTTANVCYLRNEAAGTGTARLMIYRSGATTVAGLPSASTAGSGARAFVTDATVTTFLSTVVGAGANKVPVVSDGTNWLIG
jgi:hypothetical protein